MHKDALYYYGVGLEHFENGELMPALESFLKSLDMAPHFKTYERLYHVLLSLDRQEEAEVYLIKAYEMKPNNDKVCVLYAELLLKRGENMKGLKIAKEILKRNPTYGPAVNIISKFSKTNRSLSELS